MAARSIRRREASLARADGVVSKHQQFLLEFSHHPVRSTKEASRYFIDVAATPPRRGGEKSRASAFGQHALWAQGFFKYVVAALQVTRFENIQVMPFVAGDVVHQGASGYFQFIGGTPTQPLFFVEVFK